MTAGRRWRSWEWSPSSRAGCRGGSDDGGLEIRSWAQSLWVVAVGMVYLARRGGSLFWNVRALKAGSTRCCLAGLELSLERLGCDNHGVGGPLEGLGRVQ